MKLKLNWENGSRAEKTLRVLAGSFLRERLKLNKSNWSETYPWDREMDVSEVVKNFLDSVNLKKYWIVTDTLSTSCKG